MVTRRISSSACFGAEVGHQHGEDEVGEDALQFRSSAGADLVEDHRGGAADREARPCPPAAPRSARVLAAFLEEGGEAGQRGAVARPRVVARRGHLDHRDARDVGLGGEQLDERPQAGGDPLRPGLVRSRLEGGGDMGDEDVEDGVVGLEKAGRLVLEHLLEGLP